MLHSRYKILTKHFYTLKYTWQRRGYFALPSGKKLILSVHYLQQQEVSYLKEVLDTSFEAQSSAPAKTTDRGVIITTVAALAEKAKECDQ